MRPSTLSIALVLLFVCGCSQPRFDLVIQNSTGATISNAHVKFDHFESIGGVLAPGAKKTHGGITGQVPPHVRVVWTASDGGYHDVPAVLKVPRGFSGEIVFDIQHDGAVNVTQRPAG